LQSLKVILSRLGRLIMALIKDMKGSFVGGKISRSLQNRIDLQKFNTWLKEAKNTFIKPEGSISNRPGTVFIGVAKTVSYRLTINVNVPATIIINGETFTGTSATIDLPIDNTSYEYSVSAEGYGVKIGSGTITQNTTIDVELEESVTQYTFTITNEQGATISIKAGSETPVTGTGEVSVTAVEGTTIEWSVTKEGYNTQSDTILLSEDKDLEVTLVADKTITITAYPSNANITLVINGTDTYTGQSSVSAIVQSGDTYTYTVSLNDYSTDTGDGTIGNDNVSISVTLQQTSASVANVSTENLTDSVTSLFRYNINKNGQYSIDIKGESGILYENGNSYYGNNNDYIWTGKGGVAVGTISLTAGQVVEIKAIKGGFESFLYQGIQTTYNGGCGIGVWIDDVLVLVVGGGAVEDSDYYRYGYTIGGGGYNGGISKLSISPNPRQEEYCGCSYDGTRGNNQTENAGSGGKTSYNAYGGSGYVKSEYSSSFTLTRNTNQAKASASITFVA